LNAVNKMVVGPPYTLLRQSVQTTLCCCNQKLW